VIFVSSAYAQTEAPAAPATPATAATETPVGAEHHTFPPFDPATFGSQILWLAISFIALYALMSRVALPRIGSILDERSQRVARDLADAGRLKSESEAAAAAYEQALAEARQNAHGIGRQASDAAKASLAADRARVEADLQAQLAAAETRIAEVKARALAEVDTIAVEAAQTMVWSLLGWSIDKDEVARAVSSIGAGRV
jgi:F-type H+-transporting ATPase subunit b